MNSKIIQLRPSAPVLIILPVFSPTISYLNAQLMSISNQTYRNFRCVIGFDGPCDDKVIADCPLISAGAPFLVTDYPQQVGLYRHIERLLCDFTNNEKYVALCDQDDVWFPSRLAEQVQTLEATEVDLVTDNADLIDKDSNLIGLDFFRAVGIRKACERFILTTNFATGAGTLYRSEMIPVALPFPQDQGAALHDHWLATVGTLRRGAIIRQHCSWQYRQHEQNQIGAFRGRRSRSVFLSGLTKLFEIVGVRTNSIDKQVALNVRTIKQRLGEIGPYTHDPTVRRSFIERLRYLTLESLLTSRIDSIRFATNSIRREFLRTQSCNVGGFSKPDS